MIALRILMCTSLVLWALGVGHTKDADSVQCAELNAQQRSTQCALYEYAQLAELAYGPGPANMCTLGDTGAQVGIPDDQILRVPTVLEWYGNLLRDGGDLADGYLADLYGHPLDLYEGSDGVTRLACAQEEDVRLSITFGEFLVRSVLYIAYDIRVIAPRDVLSGNLEGLDVVDLTHIRANGESDGEQIKAIKGTAFNRIPEVMATVNQLLEPFGSCVFEVAAQHVAFRVEGIENAGDHGVYDSNGRWHKVDRVAVVGHSLGGTAAQYIGATAASSDEYAGRLGSYKDNFNTYSFNGVGLREQSYGSAGASRHYSYFIDGEFASQWVGWIFGQSQIGHTIRYIPPLDTDRWPSNSAISWTGHFVESVTREPFRRHEIRVVQEAICECLNDVGSVQGAPNWHEEDDACG